MIHRYDPDVPIEETLEALHDVVKSGKARYIGAPSMWAWRFMQALALQDANGWRQRFVSMQNYLNCSTAKKSARCCHCAAIRALALFRRSRRRAAWRNRRRIETTERSETDQFGKYLYRKTAEADRAVIERVGEVSVPSAGFRAGKLRWLGISPSQA